MTFPKEVKLKGGAKVTINIAAPKLCKSCGYPIFWAVTQNGKTMPVEVKNREWQSHFATCPNADKHRKGGAEK